MYDCIQRNDIGFTWRKQGFRCFHTGINFLYWETILTNVVYSLKVDFDRTRHLSERSIKFRKTAREKLIQEEIDKERAEKLKREKEVAVADENRSGPVYKKLKKTSKIASSWRCTVDPRPQIQIERKKELEASLTHHPTSSLDVEERKLILAQRRLESLRLLDAVVEQVQVF